MSNRVAAAVHSLSLSSFKEMVNVMIYIFSSEFQSILSSFSTAIIGIMIRPEVTCDIESGAPFFCFSHMAGNFLSFVLGQNFLCGLREPTDPTLFL